MAERKVFPLDVSMIRKVPRLFDKFFPENVDLSIFSNFENETLKIGNVLDPIQIETFANKSKKLLTECKNYAAVVYCFYCEAKRRYHKAKAEVFLFESEEMWKKKQESEKEPTEDSGKKKNLTDKARDMFVDISDKVNNAEQMLIQWDALNKWFFDTYRDLESSHNWYKKLFDRVVGAKVE